MTKILIAESLDIDILKKFEKQKGIFVHDNNPIPANINNDEIHFSYQPDIPAKEIVKEIVEYEGIIVRPKEVSAKAISAGKKLKIIVRGGSGVNSIDLKKARKNDVIVENTPGQNSISTAEYTFALIMKLVANRHIDQSNIDVRIGNEKEPKQYQGQELAGKKIAIIGLGRIGSEVAKRAEAFDMQVYYHSRTKKNVSYKYFESLLDILSSDAEIYSLHVPLTNKTKGFIGLREFSLLNQGSFLINCARPQLVNPIAFEGALRGGALASAAIDGDTDLIQPFIDADKNNKCIITHHIADSTKQAQEKITKAVLTQTIEFFHNKKLLNVV